VPIADMAFAFIRRTAKGTGFHTRDMSHVHHRLLRLGHGPRRTVAILWAWTAVLSAFLLFPLFYQRANAVILFGVIVLGLALYTLFHPGLRKDTMNGTVNGTVTMNGNSVGVPGQAQSERQEANAGQDAVRAGSGTASGDGAEGTGTGPGEADESPAPAPAVQAALLGEVPPVVPGSLAESK